MGCAVRYSARAAPTFGAFTKPPHVLSQGTVVEYDHASRSEAVRKPSLMPRRASESESRNAKVPDEGE